MLNKNENDKYFIILKKQYNICSLEYVMKLYSIEVEGVLFL